VREIGTESFDWVGSEVHVKITATSRTINTKIKMQIHHPLFVSSHQRRQILNSPSLRRMKSCIVRETFRNLVSVESTCVPRSSSILENQLD